MASSGPSVGVLKDSILDIRWISNHNNFSAFQPYSPPEVVKAAVSAGTPVLSTDFNSPPPAGHSHLFCGICPRVHPKVVEPSPNLHHAKLTWCPGPHFPHAGQGLQLAFPHAGQGLQPAHGIVVDQLTCFDWVLGCLHSVYNWQGQLGIRDRFYGLHCISDAWWKEIEKFLGQPPFGFGEERKKFQLDMEHTLVRIPIGFHHVNQGHAIVTYSSTSINPASSSNSDSGGFFVLEVPCGVNQQHSALLEQAPIRVLHHCPFSSTSASDSGAGTQHGMLDAIFMRTMLDRVGAQVQSVLPRWHGGIRVVDNDRVYVDVFPRAHRFDIQSYDFGYRIFN